MKHWYRAAFGWSVFTGSLIGGLDSRTGVGAIFGVGIGIIILATARTALRWGFLVGPLVIGYGVGMLLGHEVLWSTVGVACGLLLMGALRVNSYAARLNRFHP